MFNNLYDLAKFRYECGNYQGAAEYLDLFRLLVSSSCVSQKSNQVFVCRLTNLCMDLLVYSRYHFVVFYALVMEQSAV